MPQQINLLNPVLLTKKAQISALQMARVLGVLALVGLAFYVALSTQAARLRSETNAVSAQLTAERSKLLEATKQLATPVQTTSLEAELTQARATLLLRTLIRDDLAKGRLQEGRSNAALLKTLASTTPDSIWLSAIKITNNRVEISGYALDPITLNQWLARLGDTPYFSGSTLSTVRLESVAADNPSANAPATRRLPTGTYQFSIAAPLAAPTNKPTSAVGSPI
ncbi:MAG: PilN domain-containing protein [Betaproteobacteria bacterium]|nr:PilN domain-containing protein [Betaproteobacteria bacterium]